MRRRLLFLLLFPLLPARDAFVPDYRPRLGMDLRIAATPIPFDASNPARRKAGALTFLGGWEISSRDPAFGSFSAMVIERGQLVLLNDAGGVMRIVEDAGGLRVTALSDLPGGPGDGREKHDRDSEALARHSATGNLWVGFERANAVARYAAGFARMEAIARPPAMRRWPDNAGAEAMVRLSSGRFLVFSEGGGKRAGQSEALSFASDPAEPGAQPLRFYLHKPDGYRVTEAAALPSGKVLLLFRRIGLPDYLSAKLGVIDPAAIRPDETIIAQEIATLARPLAVDNMEAMAVTREGGRTILWLGSDNNFGAAFQRTLLMKFALDGV